jgi:hypothetical protein
MFPHVSSAVLRPRWLQKFGLSGRDLGYFGRFLSVSAERASFTSEGIDTPRPWRVFAMAGHCDCKAGARPHLP